MSTFTPRQAHQRNAILASVQYIHDSPTGQRTVIATCEEGCLACLVEIGDAAFARNQDGAHVHGAQKLQQRIARDRRHAVHGGLAIVAWDGRAVRRQCVMRKIAELTPRLSHDQVGMTTKDENHV